MKKLFSSIAFFVVAIAGTLVSSATGTEPATFSSIPDTTGRAGMLAGTVGEDAIFAAGGANFPNAKPNAKTPAERGAKVFYADIWKASRGNGEKFSSWEKSGNLPKPLGYAAFAGTQKGLAVAGGCNERGHSAEAFIVSNEGKISALPPLPKTNAYAASVFCGNVFYVIGGQENENSTTALATVFALDLTNPSAGWKTLSPIPGNGRILATAGTDGKSIFVFGGCSLAKNSTGTAERTYLKSALKFDPATEMWTELAEMPFTLAASPAPAPFFENSFYLLGGDTGDFYRASLGGNAPATHPGQSSRVIVYDIAENIWVQTGKLGKGIATAPVVNLGGNAGAIAVSGETHPGVRTPLVQEFSFIAHAPTSRIIDILVVSLMAVVILILIVQAKTKGLKNIVSLSDPNTKPGLWAWIAVGVLWIVVMLNYFDRQLLSALHEPIVNDIHMTESQFGMITAVFLIIYALLSPVGGFLADRYSRRMVILGSLVVWSSVTWWTGHAQDYTTLLVARGAMGISEAFYIPAALALITDYHRGNTRSLATGIHMSGIYAGMAVAGFGGMMSDSVGWRMTFAIFGLVGVLYAFVLIVLLRDPAKAPADNAAATKTENSDTGTLKESKKQNAELSVGAVLSSLLSQRAMLTLLAVVAFAGAGNWFLLTWYPTLLQDTFGLSAGEAGPQATLWSSIAKYVAVIVGAIIADRWVQKNLKARALVPGISFAIAGPCVVVAVVLAGTCGGAAWLLPLMLALVAMQGVAQGSMDATLMPVMRSHINERYSATGYGLLNLTSAGVGALISFFGGWFKDQGIPLTTTLAVAGTLMFVCGLLFITLPKPQK